MTWVGWIGSEKEGWRRGGGWRWGVGGCWVEDEVGAKHTSMDVEFLNGHPGSGCGPGRVVKELPRWLCRVSEENIHIRQLAHDQLDN